MHVTTLFESNVFLCHVTGNGMFFDINSKKDFGQYNNKNRIMTLVIKVPAGKTSLESTNKYKYCGL
jgi:hypothetical protein